MTDDLRTLLRDRADGADLDAIDLAGVTRAGRRRTRRRRGLAVTGGLAAVALLGGVAATSLSGGSGSDDATIASEPTLPTIGLTWVVGSTLHVGSQTFDLGHEVIAYVRTSLGYVFTDAAGAVWSAHDGEIERVGTTSAHDTHLVADADGTSVGWVTPSDPRPQFEVLDQATGVVTARASAPGTTGIQDSGNGAWFEALDGDTAYWRDASGQVVVTSFTPKPGSTGPEISSSGDAEVLAAEDGTRVLAGQGDAVSIQRADGTTVQLKQVYAGSAQLSPDATYVNLDADSPEVYRTDTGTRVDLDVDGFFADGYQWLDDHTLAVEALPTKHSDWQLLTCTVPDGACTVVVPHLGNAYDDGAGAPGFQLPIGFSLGD